MRIANSAPQSSCPIDSRWLRRHRVLVPACSGGDRVRWKWMAVASAGIMASDPVRVNGARNEPVSQWIGRIWCDVTAHRVTSIRRAPLVDHPDPAARRSPRRSSPPADRTFARLSIVAAILFLVVVLALMFLAPEVDALKYGLSFYALTDFSAAIGVARQGIRRIFPVVLRPSRARCASAASFNGNSNSIRSFSAPDSIQPRTSPARRSSSARSAT